MINKKIAIVVTIALLLIGIGIFANYRIKEREATLQVEALLEQARLEIQQKEQRERNLDGCLLRAEKERWELLKLNGTEREDGSVWNNSYVTDRADKTMKEAKDNCFKRYQE